MIDHGESILHTRAHDVIQFAVMCVIGKIFNYSFISCAQKASIPLERLQFIYGNNFFFGGGGGGGAVAS